MGVFTVDPELYRRYREEVLRLGNAFQRNVKIDLPHRQRGLSDREIGNRLGLDERTVSEIRCIAERDHFGLDEWARAIEFKERACREYRSGTRAKVTARKPEAENESRHEGGERSGRTRS